MINKFLNCYNKIMYINGYNLGDFGGLEKVWTGSGKTSYTRITDPEKYLKKPTTYMPGDKAYQFVHKNDMGQAIKSKAIKNKEAKWTDQGLMYINKGSKLGKSIQKFDKPKSLKKPEMEVVKDYPTLRFKPVSVTLEGLDNWNKYSCYGLLILSLIIVASYVRSH